MGCTVVDPRCAVPRKRRDAVPSELDWPRRASATLITRPAPVYLLILAGVALLHPCCFLSPASPMGRGARQPGMARRIIRIGHPRGITGPQPRAQARTSAARGPLLPGCCAACSRLSAKALDRHGMRADVAVVLCERDMFAAGDHAASAAGSAPALSVQERTFPRRSARLCRLAIPSQHATSQCKRKRPHLVLRWTTCS